MSINSFRIKKSANLQPGSETLSEKGDLAVDDSASKLSFHNGTSASPVVTEAHTATLTNKTLTAPVISTISNTGTLTLPTATTTLVGRDTTDTLSNKTFSDAVTIAEIATPATPSSGFGRVYFKSDGKLYMLDDAGTETELAGAAFATGGILFGTGSGSTVDASNFFWDNSSKELGIGTASPGFKLHVSVNSNAGDGLAVTNVHSSSGVSSLYFLETTGGEDGRNWGLFTNFSAGGNFEIRSGNASGNNPYSTGTTHLTITSTGNITNTNGFIRSIRTGSDTFISKRTETTGVVGHVVFLDGSDTVQGTITTDTDANTTAYNTTSDVRLKQNFEDFSGLSIIDAIVPWKFERICNPGSIEYGFKAQDVNEVYSKAVTVGGEDPATQPWMMDNSKLVPILWKAVKELKSKNDTLEARIEVLEG